MPLGAAGQSKKVKTETKLEVKDGKDVTLTGCLERLPDRRRDDPVPADQRRRQEERNAQLPARRGEEGDLQSHVGHMVEIKGKAADHEDGKVKVKTKTKVDREHADDVKTESKSELKGDLIGLPLLGVQGRQDDSAHLFVTGALPSAPRPRRSDPSRAGAFIQPSPARPAPHPPARPDR